MDNSYHPLSDQLEKELDRRQSAAPMSPEQLIKLREVVESIFGTPVLNG